MENSNEIINDHKRDLIENLYFSLPCHEEDDDCISSVCDNGIHRGDSLFSSCQERLDTALRHQRNHSCLSSVVEVFGCKRTFRGDFLYKWSPLLPPDREMFVSSGPVQNTRLATLLMSGVTSMTVHI